MKSYYEVVSQPIFLLLNALYILLRVKETSSSVGYRVFLINNIIAVNIPLATNSSSIAAIVVHHGTLLVPQLCIQAAWVGHKFVVCATFGHLASLQY